MPFERVEMTSAQLKEFYDGEKAAQIAELFIGVDTVTAFVTLAGVLGKFVGIISQKEGVPEANQLQMQEMLAVLIDDARKKVYQYGSGGLQ